jgi:type I restriction enzyme, R subunit
VNLCRHQPIQTSLSFLPKPTATQTTSSTAREEFAQGNDFCKKMTYQSKEDPKSVLAQLRKDFNPRIAVTVYVIATGTDASPALLSTQRT